MTSIPDDVLRKIAGRTGVKDERFGEMCRYIEYGVEAAAATLYRQKQAADLLRAPIKRRLQNLLNAAKNFQESLDGLDAASKSMLLACFEDAAHERALPHTDDCETATLSEYVEVWPTTILEYKNLIATFVRTAELALEYRENKNTKEQKKAWKAEFVIQRDKLAAERGVLLVDRRPRTNHPQLEVLYRWLRAAIMTHGGGELTLDSRPPVSGTLVIVMNLLRPHTVPGLIPDRCPWRAMEDIAATYRNQPK